MRWYRWLLIVGLALLSACAPAHEWHGTTYQEPHSAPTIELEMSGGGTFRIPDQEDQVVLLYFGYTNCPDVCPATLADLAWLKDELGSDSQALTVAFLSVDPDRDTPGVIDEYLAKFDASFIGLHGGEQELARVKESYGVYSAKDPGDEENYTVTHTSRVFLIDGEGRLRASYSFGTPREDLLADVEHVLGG